VEPGPVGPGPGHNWISRLRQNALKIRSVDSRSGDRRPSIMSGYPGRAIFNRPSPTGISQNRNRRTQLCVLPKPDVWTSDVKCKHERSVKRKLPPASPIIRTHQVGGKIAKTAPNLMQKPPFIVFIRFAILDKSPEGYHFHPKKNAWPDVVLQPHGISRSVTLCPRMARPGYPGREMSDASMGDP